MAGLLVILIRGHFRGLSLFRLIAITIVALMLNSCGGDGSGDVGGGGLTCTRTCFDPSLTNVTLIQTWGGVSKDFCINRKVTVGGRCFYDYDGEDLGDYFFYYADIDGDGFGNPASSIIANSQTAGYVRNDSDCNDSNAAINPNATEVADGVDNNCDGQVDEITFYRDSDGDSFGDANDTRAGISQPAGFVPNSNDCDDTDAAINPNATELADGIDNNCNGQVDEGFSTFYQDNDGDSFGNLDVSQFVITQPAGFVSNYADCDDLNAINFPGALELADGVDNNCNGYIDETLGSIPINDTGITQGANYPSGNSDTCIGETIAQQDCLNGRDAEATVATLTKIGAGHAGFDYTKLDSTGAPLADQTQDYATLPWACVRDNHTGLVWEVKTDDGIHHKGRSYLWGGKTARLTGEYGSRSNEWDSLVDGSNNENLCGFSDWRLPSLDELHSIVNHDNRRGPSVDAEYFPNIENPGLHWSGTPFLGTNPTSAWFVDLYSGFVNSTSRSVRLSVRLVRNEP